MRGVSEPAPAVTPSTVALGGTEYDKPCICPEENSMAADWAEGYTFSLDMATVPSITGIPELTSGAPTNTADEEDESAGDGYSGCCDLSMFPSVVVGGAGPTLMRSSLALRSSVGSSSALVLVRPATAVAGEETDETARRDEFSR